MQSHALHLALRFGLIVSATLVLVLATALLTHASAPPSTPRAPARAVNPPIVRASLPVSTVTDSTAETTDSTSTDDSFDENVLWLARCTYSETKRPHEQRLVAWVVRNRVETRYRGRSTYRDVVLDPYQFSAFNRNSPKRASFLRLTPESDAPGWIETIDIARQVLEADLEESPFPRRTRHFYSEQSMIGRRAPGWTEGRRAVVPDGAPVEPRRFRFYSGISMVLAL